MAQVVGTYGFDENSTVKRSISTLWVPRDAEGIYLDIRKSNDGQESIIRLDRDEARVLGQVLLEFADGDESESEYDTDREFRALGLLRIMGAVPSRFPE